jgi:hypothetical protein
MTTAAIIGYVSLQRRFAVAIQTGIIMIEFIREALERRSSAQASAQTYMECRGQRSVARLRPKLMTVATTAGAGTRRSCSRPVRGWTSRSRLPRRRSADDHVDDTLPSCS